MADHDDDVVVVAASFFVFLNENNVYSLANNN